MPQSRVADSGGRRQLLGREAEVRALDAMLIALRGGESRALLLRGEPGMGKTALMDYLSESAKQCRMVGVAGVEAEMELSFAALHQLCAPMLDRLASLPEPQRAALEVTFGISPGVVPERLLVGLGVLGLMAEVAADGPLLVLIDDAQWLDEASAQTVAFVARRLRAEAVGIVVSMRSAGPVWAGLPEVVIEGLRDRDARAVVTSVLAAPVDERVLDQFVAETGGNPLALLELSRGLAGAASAGGFALPSGDTLSKAIEESFRRRVEALPADTQRLLLVAAADPLGDPLLMWRAAELLGIGVDAGRPAVDDDLVSFGARVRFRHPLVRSAIYHGASTEAKREAHGALAEVSDPAVDPERRAWHKAEATAGPDEEVAEELERYAGRAHERGGLAAAAAFLERATVLSSDAAKRAVRALAAGQAKIQAGAFASAPQLLSVAEAGPLGDLDRARLDLVRAQLALAVRRGSEAPSLLLKAARRLEAVDVDLARATYLDALMAAHLAVSFAGPEADVPAVARAAGAAPPPRHTPGPADLLLDGLADTYNKGYAIGLPKIRSAVAANPEGMAAGEELRWLSVASRSAMHIWDDQRALALSAKFSRRAREEGALFEITLAVNDRALLLLMSGERSAASSAVDEAYANAEALGNTMVPWGPMGAAAWRGDEAEASALLEAYKKSAAARGEGGALAGGAWSGAVLNNGLGRYREALVAGQESLKWINEGVFGLACWLLPELIEAGVRAGMSDSVSEAYGQLQETAAASRTEWVLGAAAGAGALLCGDDSAAAEKLYRESIDHWGRTNLRAQLARSHLLFGEWLRRQNRRVDARAELHTALEMLEEMGIEGFAERARLELRATGETARKRSADTRTDLTPQEAQIAKLAREGLSNPEIGARLYISARTVQYHLSKVFAKLGITARNELERVLA